MAGETIKSNAICLRIIPWSRTSHIVSWLTPNGKISTVVKGAVRPKSAFLGQYDLNYTCEIIYYARGKGDLHAMRECSPLMLRENLRTNFRALALADYVRGIIYEIAGNGYDAGDWYNLLSETLDDLSETPIELLAQKMLSFEMNVLKISGLTPEVEADAGAFHLRGERTMPIRPTTANAIRFPKASHSPEVIADALRAIGIFLAFHLELPPEPRRATLNLIRTARHE